MAQLRHAPPTVLLTGFAPFPGVEHNPSANLADAVAAAARRALPDMLVVSRVLPTEWERGPAEAVGLLDELDPLVAVHFGVASACESFEIEMRADNRTTDTEDAQGAKPVGPTVVPGGADRIAVSLPTRRILWKLRADGIRSKLSMDCGGYICNAVLYHALGHARASGSPRRLGFVHVPKTLVIGRDASPADRPPSLSADDAVRAGVTLLSVTLAAGAPRGHATRAL